MKREQWGALRRALARREAGEPAAGEGEEASEEGEEAGMEVVFVLPRLVEAG